MSEPKNSKDALEFIHTLDSLAIKKQKEEIARLKAEVERLDNLVRYWSQKYQNENARFLRASERIAAKEGKQS